jgi:hypothetical protein
VVYERRRRGRTPPAGDGLALVGLSRVALRDGEYDRVCSLAADARKLAPTAEAEVMPLHLLAAGTRLDGDLDAAAELYAESLELNRGLDNAAIVGMELHNLGHVEIRRGNLDAAQRHFAVTAGERKRASELVARAEQTLGQAGIVLDPDDQSEVAWLRAQL